jgi:hypothetical protein
MIATRHGLPPTTGSWILVAIAMLGLVISWGLFSLSRWGYVLTIVYLVYFGSIGFFLSGFQAATIIFGSFIWSLLVIVYLINVRKRFFGQVNQ